MNRSCPVAAALAFCAACALALVGCTRSVRVLAPPDQGSPGPVQTNPVTFVVELDARADASTFRATLDPGDLRSMDITASFSPPPTAGRQSTALITVPQTPCPQLVAGCRERRGLRVQASFRTGRAFDVTAHTRNFQLQGTNTPPPPPPPAPRIDLNLSTNSLTVAWGNSVSLTVTVGSVNGFAGMVNLALENTPSGVTHSFAPAAVNVPQNGSATSILNLTTAAAATAVAPPAVRVRATPQQSGVADRTANFDLAVQRIGGAFDEVTLRTTSAPQCGTVTATVQPTGTGPGVAFAGPPFNQTNPQTLAFSAGFAISPRCRIGIVVPPVVGTPRTGLWNLFFDPAIGAPALGGQIDNPGGVFTNGYFSDDDSLFVLVTPNPPGSGCIGAAVARLFDLVRGTQVGQSKCYTATVDSIELSANIVTLNTTPPLAQATWTVP